MNLSLQQIALWLDYSVDISDNRIMVQGVSIDSRSVNKGDLFVALSGPNFDGHHYLQMAAAAGAVAAVVERPVDSGLPQIVIKDSRIALGQFAAGWRRHCNIPTLALTGSNGKTTVKEMCAAILAEKGTVHATRGNLNNEIGVPLTLLAMPESAESAVIEMGANHLEEIDYLSQITQPNVALITNATAAHLEGFGSLEGVAKGKGEIFKGLMDCPTMAATAIINIDDPFAPFWLDQLQAKRVITFSIQDKKADIVAEVVSTVAKAQQLLVKGLEREITINLQLSGRHNAMNAVAAIAATHPFRVTPEQIVKALNCFEPVHGRLQITITAQGVTLIDDSYNANPASMQAGLQVLASYSGIRIAILGEMLELGSDGVDEHSKIAIEAKRLGVDQLWAIGNLWRDTIEDFGEGGAVFSDHLSLFKSLQGELHADTTLLIKGSRGSHMEKIVHMVHQSGVQS